MLHTMLDFNRLYYEETCSTGNLIFSRFELKPGKYCPSPEGNGTPKTFRVEDSNADEKRSGPCRAKTPEEIASNKRNR